MVPDLGNQDRLARPVGGVLGTGCDHLDGFCLDPLVRQHVISVMRVL
jgi:hypothetical protein